MSTLLDMNKIINATTKHTNVRRVSDSATLGVNDLLTLVTNTAGADVITLPPVAEAIGKIYAIYTVDGTGDSVTVVSQADTLYDVTEVSAGVDQDLSSGVAISAAGDFICLYSTGITWIVLAYKIA